MSAHPDDEVIGAAARLPALEGRCRFVHVTDGSPATKATLGSNAAHLTVRYDQRTNTVLAIGALDNLVKGASGQALQNANLVLGLPEATALSTIGLMP